MKRRFILFAAVLMIMYLSGCVPVSGNEGNGESNAVSNDGTFELSIYTDKDVYEAGEPILCWAVVEYVGGDETKTIFSSDPLVGFSLKDGKYFDGGYAVSDVLVTTEFLKSEPITYEFQKSGGWDSEDPNAEFYKEFYSKEELILPPGEYEISATINGFFDKDDYQSSKYEQSVKISVTIK